MNLITCPECRTDRVSSLEVVLGLTPLLGAADDGAPVYEDGTDLCWDSQQPVVSAAGHTRLECRRCGHQWFDAGLVQPGQLLVDGAQLREVVTGLLEWCAYTGDWDAPAWGRLRALARKVGLSAGSQDEGDDEDED